MSHRTHVRRATLTALLLALTTTSLGCAGAEALKRKEGPQYTNETNSWLSVVKKHGGQGMWLVVRGYHAGDDVVAVASNASLSHAAVLDLEKGEVIEAIGDGVKVSPLQKLLRESHRMQLIRPKGWTPERGAQAVKKARSQVGKGYDFLGVVGAPGKNRWYCSELVAWSMGVKVNKLGAWHVIHPKNLHKQGALLFDSGSRDGKTDERKVRIKHIKQTTAQPAEVKPAETTAAEVKPTEPPKTTETKTTTP